MERGTRQPKECVSVFSSHCQLPKLFHVTACSCRATLLKRCHQCPQKLGIRPLFLAGCYISCYRMQSDINYSSTIFFVDVSCTHFMCIWFLPCSTLRFLDGLGLVQFPLVYGETRENLVA